MKELDIVRKFKAKLKGHWTPIETSVTSGVPDYMASINGHMCWIEFKRLYGCDIIVRPLQRNWMLKELPHNGRVAVAWWDDGPALLLARHLVNMEPTLKGGKLHYYVQDHACVIHGWGNIHTEIFES